MPPPPKLPSVPVRGRIETLPGVELQLPDLPGPLGVGLSASRRTSVRSRRELLATLTGAASGPSAPASRPDARPNDPLLRLVHRVTQGFDLDEYRRARRLGYDAYLDEQLDPASIDDSETDARLAGIAVLQMSPKEVAETWFDDAATPFWQLKGATLVRSVHSRRQLYERMCELWNDHFSIDHHKESQWALMPENDQRVVRQHALGGFYAMLSASAHSGAMMVFLDNWLNVAGNVQENWARELMELHTLGLDGGYSEEDVRQVAECFTGWTLDDDVASPDQWRWAWKEELHQPGPKLVLGQTIPADPPLENGLRVLQILASHASTARFVAGKVTRWLLREDPPAALIDQVAQVYTDTQGDLRAMVRTTLAQENLRGGSPAWAPKLKRPFHFMTSLLRGVGAQIKDPLSLGFYLHLMGHAPFGRTTPDGYPDTAAAWGSSLLPRWTFASHLMAGAIPGVSIPLEGIAARLGSLAPADLARRIDDRILGRSLGANELGQIQRYVDDLGTVDGLEVLEVIGLAASAPGYQWY